jgi:hypothetical protein
MSKNSASGVPTTTIRKHTVGVQFSRTKPAFYKVQYNLNGPANYPEYLTYTSEFKCQYRDQDNLVQLLGPFRHDRNFTNFL